jgi:hypothetical protein
MVRMQIQLKEDQGERLKAAAASRGISMAELIREAIDLALSRGTDRTPAETRQRALAAAGRFHSGLKTVSVKHDNYLAEDLHG